MNIFINLTACSCNRDHIFLESLPLLKELLQHLQDVAHNLEGDCLWGSDSVSAERLGQGQLEVDTIVHCDKGMPLEIVDTVRQSFRNPGDLLLILSPFRGVISTSRIEAFLESCSQDTVSASTFEITSNANPFWLNMIDPNSRREVGCYIDVHDSVLPDLSLKHSFCKITNSSAWIKFFKNNEIYGSQWLPTVKMLNQAMVFVPMIGNGELRPVFCETIQEEDLPLLYRLPLFEFAKNEHLSL